MFFPVLITNATGINKSMSSLRLIKVKLNEILVLVYELESNLSKKKKLNPNEYFKIQVEHNYIDIFRQLTQFIVIYSPLTSKLEAPHASNSVILL